MQQRPVRQKRFSQILGISMAASLLVASVIVVHGWIKQAIAARTIQQQICLAPQQPEPTCFTADPNRILSSKETTAIATQPGGPILAAAFHNTIQLWDLNTQQRLPDLTGHRDWITAIAISPDGSTLASSSMDQTIKLWNLNAFSQTPFQPEQNPASRSPLTATIPSGRVTNLAFSPDSATLASASHLARWVDGSPSPQGIQLWNVATQQQITTIAASPVSAIAFSPNGQYLAAGLKTTQIWQLPSGTLLHRLNSNELNSLVFSHDGETLITGSDGIRGENGTKFWQVSSGKQVRVLHSVAGDFALSPNGKNLATTYGGTVNLWRTQPFGYLGTLRGSLYSGLSVAFGQNGRVIVIGSSDGIKLWQPQSANQRQAPRPNRI